MAARLAELFPADEPAGAESPLQKPATQGSPAQGSPARSETLNGSDRPRFRLQVSMRAAIAGLILVAVVCVGLFWSVSRSDDEPSAADRSSPSLPVQIPAAPEPAGGDPPASSGAAGNAIGTSSSSGEIVVHVAGAVRTPGVVRLKTGSRLFEALEAVGGALPEAGLSGVNLAAVLKDGEKVLLPTQEQLSAGMVPAPSVDSGSPQPSTEQKISLNSATLEQLATLPRVGPKTAQKIVDWRQQNSGFRSIDELDAVDGIGTKMLETLRPLLVL